MNNSTAVLKNQSVTSLQVAAFMDKFSIEITPGAAKKIDNFADYLCKKTTVYVTFLPGSNIDDTIATCEKLRLDGMEPVPHIAARSIPNKNFLAEKLKQLKNTADINKVLVIAGAMKEPLGDYMDSMQLLETGLFDLHGIKSIGLAAHPEGSPDMSDEAIDQALIWKNSFAERTDAQLHIITQFCFEAAPIIAWDKKINLAGNRLPIHIGIPGIASIKSLLGHAIACGVGPSMQVIKKQSKNISKLLFIQSPDKLITALAKYKANDTLCSIEKVHMYPLGGLAKSAYWSYEVSNKKIIMNADNSGFNAAYES